MNVDRTKSEPVKSSLVINADFDCDFDFEENFGNIDALVKAAIRRLCKKFKIKACAISKNAAYLSYVKF